MKPDHKIETKTNPLAGERAPYSSSLLAPASRPLPMLFQNQKLAGILEELGLEPGKGEILVGEILVHGVTHFGLAPRLGDGVDTSVCIHSHLVRVRVCITTQVQGDFLKR